MPGLTAKDLSKTHYVLPYGHEDLTRGRRANGHVISWHPYKYGTIDASHLLMSVRWINEIIFSTYDHVWSRFSSRSDFAGSNLI